MSKKGVGEMVVGIRDWEHEGWVKAFYPDDMPGEWRLTYYANEFRAVLVPPERWVDAGDEEIEAWCNDVHEAFGFFLELPSSGQVGSDLEDHLQRLGSMMGDALAGVVCSRQKEDERLHIERLGLKGIACYLPVSLAREREGVQAFSCHGTEPEAGPICC
ncbi:hypothetical protein [Solemya velesiana gill symbiont]|nr:hypothetical protein [Solemya velesiana gill symbiont]